MDYEKIKMQKVTLANTSISLTFFIREVYLDNSVTSRFTPVQNNKLAQGWRGSMKCQNN